MKETTGTQQLPVSDMSVSNREETGFNADINDQYLTFIMNAEEYGIDILCVQEIRGWESATPLPKAPPHIKGVINLRGTIVPLIDLRSCFGMGVIEYNALKVVIILKVASQEGHRIMGIVVDAVSDVYAIANVDIRPSPDLGASMNTEFIKGLVDINKKMIILLDVDRLLTMDEMPNLAKIATQLDVKND